MILKLNTSYLFTHQLISLYAGHGLCFVWGRN